MSRVTPVAIGPLLGPPAATESNLSFLFAHGELLYLSNRVDVGNFGLLFPYINIDLIRNEEDV